ncbi:condensation domain-containing protein [Gordonia malaquae]|uniref:condensation domain-containing protein n=1 Tax=Gordonia malaquae TaxID=410332 RepID=UPI0030C79FDA
MEYSELADYPLHGGQTIGWVPTAHADAWRNDHRPLSTDHEAHVACATSAPEAAAGSWIGTAFRVEEPLDTDAFGAVIGEWIARHEAYRTTAVPAVGGRGFTRATVPADAIAVEARRAPEPRGSAEICSRIETFFADVVSAVRWPHLAVVTVEPAPASPWFTVVFAADHAVMDAYTQVIAIAELTELYRARVQGRAPLLPPVGSYVDFSAFERAVDDALDHDHPVVQRWAGFLGADRRLPAFPLPVSRPTGDTAPDFQASLSRWLLDDDATEAFVAAAKGFGGSQTSGFLSAVKTALGRLGADGLRFIMPMHTRNAPEFAVAAGWFVGVMPVDDPIGHAASFGETIGGTSAAIRANRDVVPFSLPRVTSILDVPGAPEFVVSFVDGRAVPGADAWTEHERALRSRVRSGSEVYLWINRAAGGLNLSMRYPNNEIAASSVHAFVAEFAAVLSEVVETGDAALGRPVRIVQ